MPRQKHFDKKRHYRVTLELRCLVANMHAAGDPGVNAQKWFEFWGGPAEGRAAFEALHADPALGAEPGSTFEGWLERLATASSASRLSASRVAAAGGHNILMVGPPG